MIRSFIPITVGSAVGYQCLNSALDYDFLPAPPGKYAGQDRHRWRNAATSLINSAIIASFTVYCFLSHPALWYEPQTYYAVSADICFAVISGYLIYDTGDLMVHSRLSKVWSVVVHHVIMIVVLYMLSVERLAFGTALITLLFEFSAMFLHSRQLLLMYGFSKHSRVFSVHKIFNLLSFMMFRLAPISYSTYISFTYPNLPTYLAAIVPFLMTTIVVFNCVLLWRLLSNDFLRKDVQDTHIMDN